MLVISKISGDNSKKKFIDALSNFGFTSSIYGMGNRTNISKNKSNYYLEILDRSTGAVEIRVDGSLDLENLYLRFPGKKINEIPHLRIALTFRLSSNDGTNKDLYPKIYSLYYSDIEMQNFCRLIK